jgi:hypothetical protein
MDIPMDAALEGTTMALEDTTTTALLDGAGREPSSTRT